MNNRHLMTLLQENYTTVEAIFTGKQSDADNPDLKRYTYKIPLNAGYVEGDFAVVVSPSGLTVVMIVKIHQKPKIDLDSEFTYKWLVQRLDLTEYEERQQKEETFLEMLTDIERTHQRNILLNKFQECLDEESRALFENARMRLLGDDEGGQS